MRIGDTVRLKGKKRMAKIVALLSPEIKGGIRLDKPLGGYHYWNVLDIEKVK